MKHILILIVLFCFCARLNAQSKKQQVANLTTERDSLTRMLADERATCDIHRQECKEKLTSKEYEIVKLKKEGETLRSIMKSYIHTIDSLNTVNQEMDTRLKQKKNN